VVNVAPFTRRTRTAVIAACVAVVALLIATLGPALAAGIAVVLPALLVAVSGSWVVLMAGRRHRRLADAAVAVTLGTALLALARHDVLAVAPAAGLLFPVAVWAGVRAWQALNAADRLAVRAVADITLSLLLGADLVLFVVWLANLLDLSQPEVAALRDALARTGDLADLPWWLWTSLYAALAAGSVAFAVWPVRLRRAIGVSARLRVVPVIDAVRRVQTGVYLGLLVIVLVAAVVPAAVFPLLRGQLVTRYTVAYQRQLAAAGELAAYAEISREFPAAPANRAVLAGIVARIHAIDPPPPGADQATATEADLGRRVGELQAVTVLAASMGFPAPAGQGADAAASAAAERTAVGAAEQRAVDGAGLTGPVRDAPDLATRVTKLSEREKAEEAAHKRAEQAGDLAAATVANLLNLPDVGRNEVVQIVREYLSGLIEGSSIKDVFTAWTERFSGAQPPPDAGTLVVPDPAELETEAQLTEFEELAKDHFGTTLPSTTSESAVDAAVDLANQTRYLAEGGTGPCAGCGRVEFHDKPVHEPFEDHPIP
jgi:hypothetical protein